MADIDSAACRVLRLKFKMGLFENPYVNPIWQNQVRNIRHKTLAKVASRASFYEKQRYTFIEKFGKYFRDRS